ncbi:hypothetical protein Tco_0252889 [Tanacetum coccineum]
MHSSLWLDIRLLSYSIVRNPWSSLIPLSRGSFDVIVGMDWLSKRKFVIVCYEKVVRIPLEGDEILRVHRERTLGAAKSRMNAKKGRVKLRRVRAMSMTIQSSVKDKILATSSETSKYEYEIRYHPGKANVVADALSKKERVKPTCSSDGYDHSVWSTRNDTDSPKLGVQAR